jgi:hypothetical protein
MSIIFLCKEKFDTACSVDRATGLLRTTKDREQFYMDQNNLIS